MKNLFRKMKDSGLLTFAILLLCSLFGVMGTESVYGAEGTVTYGEPVSLEYANENAPEIVRATIEREVTVAKPHLTPLYTIAANRGKVKSGTHPLIEYDEVETQAIKTKMATAYTGSGAVQGVVDLQNNDLVAINQTLYFKGVDGYKEDGTTVDGWFVAYIKDKDSSGKPIIVPVNGKASGGKTNTIPTIPVNTVVIRGARTASEKQSRTAPLTAVPTKKTQYMQKLILETEETTFFVLAQKEADVKWTKTETTDYAIYEHKQTAEADMLLGKKKKITVANKYNGNKPDVTWFQEGIWWQAGKDFTLPINPQRSDLISLMKKAFVGNASSNTKVLLAGADVVEAINKVDYNQVIYPGKKAQAFGLDVQRIIYGQYTLMIVAEPAFDDLGMSNSALIIDEAYLTKYKHNWRSIPLDNLKNGESDSKSQVYIDTFGLVLKNSKAHTRVHLS